ncbi:MAG TPA: hypothetical protein GX745_03625 [Clostridiales bacterium]|nr:hypothetical protein [Clostridiales bacterium]
MVSLIALIIPGYALRKAKMFSDGAVSAFVSLLLYVCQPMITLSSFLEQDAAPTSKTSIFMGLSFLFSLAGHLVVFFVAKLIFFKWKNKENASAYIFATFLTNSGFLGIPFIKMLTDKPQAVLFAVIYNVVFNMLIWTLGIYLLTGDKSAISVKKAFINPAILPLFVALPLYFFPPINIISGTPIANAISLLANISAPLSMVVVGIRLADMGIKEAFKGWGNYLSSFVGLVLAPAILLAAAVLLKNIPYFNQNDLLFLAVPVILMSMPTAASLVAFAEKTNRAQIESTRVFLTSTILSALTIPLIILVVGAAGLI